MDQLLTLDELLGILKRNLFQAILTICICLGLAIIVVYQLKPTYQATADFSIKGSYFKNPLVSDFLPEEAELEVRQQRDNIVRLALNDEYLEDLGKRYKLFPPKTEIKTSTLELLRSRIQIIPLTATNFQFKFSANSGELAYKVLQDVLNQLSYTLFDQRFKKLERARKAIETQVKFLGKMLKENPPPKSGGSTSADPANSSQTEVLESELEKINQSIASLRKKFTDSHPQMFALREQAATVRARLNERLKKQQTLSTTPSDTAEPDEYNDMFKTIAAAQSTQDIFNYLLRKLSYLNILLQMEGDRDNPSYLDVIQAPMQPDKPAFPVKRNFAIAGFGLGVVLSVLQTIYFELRRTWKVSATSAAHSLGVPFLGELPPLTVGKSPTLLESKVSRFSAHLPGPESKGSGTHGKGHGSSG